MSFKAAHALELLDRARESGRLGHAYLVCGPREAGLEEFAVKFLNLVSGSSLPDLDAWAQAGAPVLRPESKSRRIVIGEPGSGEGIREMERRIHLSVTPGGHKFAVIVDADRMTEQAQNAFLKTLEEPPARTLILLTSEQPEQFLPTTLSRVIRVPLMPESSVRQLGADEQRLAAVLTRLSRDRRPDSLASALAVRREFEDILDSIRARIEKQLEGEFEAEKKFLKQTTDVSSQTLEKVEDEMAAAVQVRFLHQRTVMIELLLSWMGDVMRHQVGADRLDLPSHAEATRALANRWDAAAVNRAVRELRRLDSNLHTNVNAGLALDSAFIAAFA